MFLLLLVFLQNNIRYLSMMLNDGASCREPSPASFYMMVFELYSINDDAAKENSHLSSDDMFSSKYFDFLYRPLPTVLLPTITELQRTGSVSSLHYGVPVLWFILLLCFKIMSIICFFFVICSPVGYYKVNWM